MLENAQSVSLNGYSISADLAMVMRDKRLNVEKDILKTTGNWIEVVDELPIEAGAFDEDRPSASTVEITSESSSAAGASKTTQCYSGWTHHYLQAQAFWQLHECEPDDGLVIATARLAAKAG